MKKRLLLMAVALVGTLANVMADDDLTSFVTKASSVTITSSTNDTNNPWVIEDGVLHSTNSGANGTTAAVWYKFTCEHPTIVTMTYDRSFANASSQMRIYRNGSQWTYYTNNAENATYTLRFPAGENNFGFALYNWWTSSPNEVRMHSIDIADVEDMYTDITLSAPGTLGTEVLGEFSTLPDAKYLRISGAMNSTDWATMKNLTGLIALDMTGVTNTEIPASAFTSNGSLSFYKFPSAVTTIGTSAFEGRVLYGPIDIPATVTSIGNRAYYNCDYISSVNISDNVTSLGENIFYDCDRLRSIHIGTGITATPTYFAYNCDSLTYVTGAANVSTVGSQSFLYCYYLESVGQMKPTRVNTEAFYYCHRLEAIDLGETTNIGSSAFRECDSLKVIDMTNVTSMSNNAFYGCESIERVEFNDRITTIPDNAFAYCNKLKEVVLGASVRSIGSNAFYYNSSNGYMTKVYVNSPAPPTVSSNPFQYNSATVLYVPEYAMTSYKLHDYWSKYTVVEPNTNPVEGLVLYSDLNLTSNARIPNTPNMELGWANNIGGKLVVNGNNAQAFAKYTQYATLESYSPCLISRCENMTCEGSEIRYWCANANTYWYYVAMPFDVNVSDIYTRNGANFACRYYDGMNRADNSTGNSWKDVSPQSTLKKGQGYIFCVSAADYICLPATSESKDDIFLSTAYTTTLNDYASEVSADAGWNLVGNPYPCFYDIYYMDYTAPLTVWNTNNKTFTAYSVADDDLALTPLQAFFVQKPSNVNAITFQPLGRQTSNVIEHNVGIKAAAPMASPRKVVNLLLSDGLTEDRTRIVVNPYASDSYEAETDASKMMSHEAHQFYSLRGGVQYAINEGQQADGNVALGLWTPAQGTYTISCSRADADVELLDNGQAVQMPYTFSAEQGTTEGRFSIRILAGDATGISSTLQTSAEENAIYDLSGRRVAGTAAKGIYINNGKKVLK